MPKVLLGFALAAALGLAPACSDSNPPASPSQPPDLAGTWNGSVTVSDTSARMTWALSQNGTAVTGPVTLALMSGIVLMNGVFTGTLTGTSLTGTIGVSPGGIPIYPTCTGQLSATMNVTAGSVLTLSGPVAVTTSTCTVPFTSSVVTLTRQ